MRWYMAYDKSAAVVYVHKICYKNCNIHVDQPLVHVVNQDLRQADATILQILCGWLTYSDVISRFGQFVEVTVVVYKQ